MFGFTSTTKQATHFDAVNTMDDDERQARYSAQKAGDTRTVAFGFCGTPRSLTQTVTSTTDPSKESK